MANTARLRRKVGTWTLAANSESTFDLPRVQNYEFVVVELDAVVNLSVAGSAVRAEAPAQLLKRIQLVADGKDTLSDVPFSHVAFGNYAAKFAKEITAPGSAGTGNSTVRAVGFINISNLRGWREKDTAFQAYLTRLLQLRVTSGAANDLFTGTPTGTITSGTVNVYVGSHDELEKVDGTTDQGEPKRVKKRSTQVLTYSSANAAQQFQLPLGNSVRLVSIHALDSVNSSNVGEPSNALINNIKLSLNDTDVRFNVTGKATRSMMANDLSVPIGDIPTGFYVADSSPLGKFSEYWDMRGDKDHPISRAILELDLAAPTTLGLVEIVTEEEIY